MEEDLFDNVVIGVLLGDASIQKNTNKNQKKWRLKFSQQVKHKSYIEHLHSFFKDKDYVKAKPFYDDKRKMVSFQTLFDPRFNKFAKMFIDEHGKKQVPKCFFTVKISPVTLAYWFMHYQCFALMDDGGSNSYNPRKGIVFNTQSFTRAEVDMLSNSLNKHYNINSWVKVNKGKPVIAISEAESKNFAEHFLPYLHKTMTYKLSFEV